LCNPNANKRVFFYFKDAILDNSKNSGCPENAKQKRTLCMETNGFKFVDGVWQYSLPPQT